MYRKDDKVQGTFISEIEISKGLLVNIFEKFLDRISPRKEEVNDMNYFPVRDCDTGDKHLRFLRLEKQVPVSW